MPLFFYRYTFLPAVNWQDIVDTLTLAVLGATALHGETAARLDCSYCLNDAERIIEVASATRAGTDLNRLFTLYAAKEFGANSFTVARIEAGLSSTLTA